MVQQIKKLLLIREGETGAVVYFFAFFMLVSAGMAIGRGTADALFLKRMGIELLPLMYMGQSVVLSIVCLAYTAYADRISAESFFRTILLVLLCMVLLSWTAMTVTTNHAVYPVYYLVYEVASEVLLVHVALYMNQNMTTVQAKRLTPLFYAGAQTGTIGGGLLLAAAAPVAGSRNMLLIWCLLLLICTVLLFAWHGRHGTSKYYRAPSRTGKAGQESLRQIRQGIRYTWRSDLLRAASFSLFFMVISFYILCYSVNRVYSHTFATENELAGFFGMLTAATSAVALLMQVIVTGRIIRRFGVRQLNLLFPVTTLAAIGGLAGSFTLPFALLGSLNKDALLPAFRNPVKALFYNVVPDYMQGRARAISVALILPLALFTCGMLLMLMQRLENPVYYLLPGMAAAALYLLFNVRMNRAYMATLIGALREKLILPRSRMYADLAGSDGAVMEEIIRGVNHEMPEVAIAFSRLLAESFPAAAAGHIIARAETADTVTANRLLELLCAVDVENYRDRLCAMAGLRDDHFRATVSRLVADHPGERGRSGVDALLASDNPRLRATGIRLALHHSGESAAQQALGKWAALLDGGKNDFLAASDIAAELARLDEQQRAVILHACRSALRHMQVSGELDGSARLLGGLSRWPPLRETGLQEVIEPLLGDSDPQRRAAAAGCLHHLDDDCRTRLFLLAAGDGHPRVREAAVSSVRQVCNDYSGLVLQLLTGNRGSPRAQRALLETLPEGALPMAAYEDIAAGKVAEALRLRQALHVLERDPGREQAALRIAGIALQERLEQTVLLALQALEPLYERGVVQTIRAGFSSGDERYIANAREALSTLEGGRVKSLLESVLQDGREQPSSAPGRLFGTVDDVVEWCACHTDEWLNECARNMVQYGLAEEVHG